MQPLEPCVEGCLRCSQRLVAAGNRRSRSRLLIDREKERRQNGRDQDRRKECERESKAGS